MFTVEQLYVIHQQRQMQNSYDTSLATKALLLSLKYIIVHS